MKPAIILLALALAACATTQKPGVVTKDRIVTVNKAVATDCVGERPAEPVTLLDKYTDPAWDKLHTFERWREIGRNAIAWAGYGDKLGTETSACQ